MDIITPKAHRALLYLVTLAAGGAAPTIREFDEYADIPDVSGPGLGDRDFAGDSVAGSAQRSAVEKIDGRNASANGVRVGRFGRSAGVGDGGYADHFIRLGWARIIRGGGYLSPTPLAYALVRGLTTPPLEPEAVEVTSSLDNPIAYGVMLQRMTAGHDVLVVDPFLSFEQFQHLVTVDAVKRILIKPQDPAEQAAFASVLRGWSDAPEVRETGGMQDRYVLPRRGEAFIVGASAGTTGNKSLALVNLGGFSEDVRVRCERWWEQAKPFKHEPQMDGEAPGHAIMESKPAQNVLEMPPKK